MRKTTLLMLAMLSAMALMTVAPAFAQDRLEATIPFAFNVGSKSLPSGNYEVRKAFANTLVIQNAATNQAVMAITMDASLKAPSESAEAVLLFHKYGDTCFLSEIRTWDNRQTLSPSKVEREAATKATESAQNTTPREVYVAANIH